MNRKNVIYYTLIITWCLLLPSLAVAASWTPEDVLKTYLKNNYPWEEIEVSNVRVIGKIHMEMPEKITVKKGPIGKAIFSFVFNTNKRVIVKANVKAFDKVIKSKRSFKKGHVIGESDIYISKMDIRKMPNSSVRNPEKIIGKPLKRSIIANIPIVENMVEKSQVVKRGKRVVLLINYQGLNITTAGKIKEKGYVGMPVKAINLSSKREVRGVLIDENTVQVEL